MPSKPMLTEADREALRERLSGLCEERWIERGYKKTSIKELCEGAGMSVGTFYTLYPTKEDLFCETIAGIQEELEARFLDTIAKNPTKEGFAQAMKDIFREYASKPFLYNVGTADFQSFASKLPADTLEKISFDSFEFFGRAVDVAGLALKVAPEQAYGTLSALLSIISAKNTLSLTCNYLAVFDYMTDVLVSGIFE
ncbi:MULTISPECIES: TetR/AcrR family transcriptional regulator [Coriobacteriia]|uniref:HTH tetR-type domain-containing protein n=2 Tax=Coriobacteriia TaxID=84998 RepID=R9KUY6_9ACTN|nr:MULTISPECIES: TetR/AcrR family transcriptional regulator [Coriobacteriia]EOS50354.1 hypothetical protein C811_01986 [Adlercreutzia caecimuris B7]MBB3170793.1 AcrR family transcriptional regulator [Parvibacter caecicola]MCR2042466.1 TetR/AcrR family transcriptional regulator [Parvibacter caecicola]RNL10299.1 TetR/AcrR family transcriptional regulator [Parvibacter caecicola]